MLFWDIWIEKEIRQYRKRLAALGIPVGTVKSRLNCARKSLEKDLEEYMDE